MPHVTLLRGTSNITSPQFVRKDIDFAPDELIAFLIFGEFASDTPFGKDTVNYEGKSDWIVFRKFEDPFLTLAESALESAPKEWDSIAEEVFGKEPKCFFRTNVDLNQWWPSRLGEVGRLEIPGNSKESS